MGCAAEAAEPAAGAHALAMSPPSTPVTPFAVGHTCAA